MPISKDLKNTWQVADEYYEELANNEDNPQLELFEMSWQNLSNNLEEYTYLSTRHSPNTSEFQPTSPLDRFLSDVSEGIYPTPEVLFVIAECFHHYFNSEGNIDLEEVFFGVGLEKGTGNYSAQRKRHERFSKIALWENFEKTGVAKTNRKRTGLPSFIESNPHLLALLNEEEDLDSFLRSYRRWKKATNQKISNLDKDEFELYYQRFLR